MRWEPVITMRARIPISISVFMVLKDRMMSGCGCGETYRIKDMMEDLLASVALYNDAAAPHVSDQSNINKSANMF